MTRKRCIKILMEAIGSSKYRQTEKAFAHNKKELKL